MTTETVAPGFIGLRLNWSLFDRLNRFERVVAMLMLSGALALALLGAWRASAELGPYAFADWLINYHGGFTRRGLLGELFLGLRDLTGIHAEWLVFAAKAACYAVIYGIAGWLLWSAPSLTRAHALALLSPGALAFDAFDIDMGGRKELLLLAWAAILVLRQFRNPASTVRYTELAIGWALLTACHEGLLFFWPQFVLLLYLLAPPRSYDPVRLVLSAVPAAIIFLAVSFIFVTPDVGTVCAALRESMPAGCAKPFGSAIAWLNANVSFGVRSVIAPMTIATLLNGLLGIALSLGFIAYVALRTRASASNALSLRQQVWLMVAGLAGLLIICVLAIDWGRWIHIAATLLAFGAVGQALSAQPASAGRTPVMGSWPRALWVSFCGLAFAGFYEFAWRVPHCCIKGALLSWPAQSAIRHGAKLLGL